MPSESQRGGSSGLGLAPEVGEMVRYKQWTGRVRHVYSNGMVLIDFTASPGGGPFFHGPYSPDELEAVTSS